MNQLQFESKMLRAQTMHDQGDRPDYWSGYMRGLRRLYHGSNFGTAEDHKKWMSLAGDSDESRSERGHGYRDGLSAEETSKAAAAMGRKGGASKSAVKQSTARENGKKGGRPPKKKDD